MNYELREGIPSGHEGKNKPSSPMLYRLVTPHETGYRHILIAATFVFVALFLLLPLVSVLYEAFRSGLRLYLQSFIDPVALAAIRLTLIAAAFSVVLNLVFGLAAAWAITKFDFPLKSLLLTIIDLPFAISPVISGLIFVLIFGINGWFGPWLSEHGIRIIFAVPGIVLVTLFITLPFVVRELVPVMQSLGRDDEEAAMVLGANGWQIFFRITLPNVIWGILYGVILTNARAMGEFGAVSVVSGHIRGLTNTLPLHIEVAYNEYNFTAAFACASLLSFLAIVTLIAKTWVERKMRSHLHERSH